MKEKYIRGQRVIPPKERIMSKVDKCPESGCWNWTGAMKGRNPLRRYGNLVIGSRTDGSRRTVSAHRYAYEVFVGPIPEGLFILHECDNPSCVNPEHLFPGTRQDNVDDREAKGRNNPPRGARQGRAKLNPSIVTRMRKLFMYKDWSARQLGREYNVHHTTVLDAVHGESWSHIPIPEPPEE